MISIIINWLIIILNCYTIGWLSNILFKIKHSFSIVTIIGIIVITTFTSIASFFGPINYFHLLLLQFISTIILIFYRKEITNNNAVFCNSKNIIILGLSVIVFSYFSSGFSNINDDGLYYIQTIKWLQEYGFTHGISNLHLSLGLGSSWHIFQALFSIPTTINLNDINGLLLLVFTIFMLETKNNKPINLLFYTQYLLALLFSIPFFSAPNPDFAIIIFTIIGFQIFLANSNNKQHYALLIVLAAFCYSIKISAIAISILALFAVFQKKVIKQNKHLIILAISIIGISLLKNVYQTGYPFYPYKIFAFNVDWRTPESIIGFFTNGVKSWSFSNSLNPNEINQLQNISQWDLLKTLLTRPSSKGFINQIIGLTFIVSTFVVFYLFIKNKIQKNIFILQVIISLSLILWFLFAPQYRFALPMLLYFLALIIYLINKYWIMKFVKLKLHYFHIIILLIMLIPAFWSINIKVNSTSNQIGQFNKINSKQLFIPKPQYTFEKIDTITINGNQYFHPQDNMYCWNVSLPCLSQGYDEIIYKNYGYRISLRTNSVNDGFKFIHYNK
jgi:hypothetical protein